eukprot:jgi/Tetstr1/426797/TSEL_017012.t1
MYLLASLAACVSISVDGMTARDYDLKSKLREEPVRSAKTASHVETIEALKALAINRDFPTDMRSLSRRLLDTPVYAV